MTLGYAEVMCAPESGLRMPIASTSSVKVGADVHDLLWRLMEARVDPTSIRGVAEGAGDTHFGARSCPSRPTFSPPLITVSCVP